MVQLHVDELTAQRCRVAMRSARAITVSGLDGSDRVRSATGTVESVLTSADRGPTRHFLVTIFEEPLVDRRGLA